jgi:hypothetical protein
LVSYRGGEISATVETGSHPPEKCERSVRRHRARVHLHHTSNQNTFQRKSDNAPIETATLVHLEVRGEQRRKSPLPTVASSVPSGGVGEYDPRRWCMVFFSSASQKMRYVTQMCLDTLFLIPGDLPAKCRPRERQLAVSQCRAGFNGRCETKCTPFLSDRFFKKR